MANRPICCLFIASLVFAEVFVVAAEAVPGRCYHHHFAIAVWASFIEQLMYAFTIAAI